MFARVVSDRRFEHEHSVPGQFGGTRRVRGRERAHGVHRAALQRPVPPENPLRPYTV